MNEMMKVLLTRQATANEAEATGVPEMNIKKSIRKYRLRRKEALEGIKNMESKYESAKEGMNKGGTKQWHCILGTVLP